MLVHVPSTACCSTINNNHRQPPRLDPFVVVQLLKLFRSHVDMIRIELILKSLRSNEYKQPRPVRPFEMTDAIASFERVSLSTLWSEPLVHH